MNAHALFYDVLDELCPGWENRRDDYYLAEIAFLICFFGSSYCRNTISQNLRQNRVEKYRQELIKIYQTPIEKLRKILQERMTESRKRACEKRYLHEEKRTL